MEVEVDFPSSARIQARSKDLVVEIGPPPHRGGDPEAYGPFDMLLCALATCTGFQVLDFLQQRGMPVAEAGLNIKAERDAESHLLDAVSIEIKVPPGFPEKHEDAIIRATELCLVKKQLGHRPEFRMSVIPGQGSNGRPREL